MVRSGLRASERYSAVDSKPMNAAKANASTPTMPGANIADGAKESAFSGAVPSAPPLTITATTSSARIAVSAISSTPSSFAPTSTPRRPMNQTMAIATSAYTHQGAVTPVKVATASLICWPSSP